jgi:hypothetical protein
MLLFVGIVAFVVIFAGGFCGGWYVRGAYPPKCVVGEKVERPKAWPIPNDEDTKGASKEENR